MALDSRVRSARNEGTPSNPGGGGPRSLSLMSCCNNDEWATQRRLARLILDAGKCVELSFIFIKPKEYKVTIKEGASGHETYYYRADCRPYCNYRDDGFLVSHFGTSLRHNYSTSEVPGTSCLSPKSQVSQIVTPKSNNYSTAENLLYSNRFRDKTTSPWFSPIYHHEFICGRYKTFPPRLPRQVPSVSIASIWFSFNITKYQRSKARSKVIIKLVNGFQSASFLIIAVSSINSFTTLPMCCLVLFTVDT